MRFCIDPEQVMKQIHFFLLILWADACYMLAENKFKGLHVSGPPSGHLWEFLSFEDKFVEYSGVLVIKSYVGTYKKGLASG